MRIYVLFLVRYSILREYPLKVGVDCDEVPPVPIPNTVVKLVYGDNTWLATAREDNSTPTSKQQRKLLLFLFILKNQRVFACEEEKAKASIGVREKPSEIMRKRRQPFAVGVAFMRL